jgi:hypothetical protein
LFLILVKRSIFITLNDDEKDVVLTVTDLIGALPGNQRPYYNMFRKFLPLSLVPADGKTQSAPTISSKNFWTAGTSVSLATTTRMSIQKIQVAKIQTMTQTTSRLPTKLPKFVVPPSLTNICSLPHDFLPYSYFHQLPSHLTALKSQTLARTVCVSAMPAFSLCLLIITIFLIQTLDRYSNEIQDKFFKLTVAADSEELTVSQTRELMYFYTMLRLVDHSALNHENYTILYKNCIGEAPSLEATNLNNLYKPWAEVRCSFFGSNLCSHGCITDL